MNIHLQATSVPAYVEIYNSLFSDIVNGVYPQGECLPGEIALAQKYNVSRNTLRQAMAILCEDGLLVRARGKGTMVVEKKDEPKNAASSNPLTAFPSVVIDKTDISYNFTAPTDIAQSKLDLGKSDILLASYLVYHSGDTVVGYSFVQVPVKLLSRMQVDVSSAVAMNRFLNEELYAIASYQTIAFKLIFVNETETEYLRVEENAPVHLLECLLYSADGQPIARCKHYMRPEYYKISYTVRL
ncbi:MAG: GntR family transcriptional regulator [Clostridiales bacterium]|nr:GntR family transcriptional regulator [Clostridiales bacterium]